VCRNGNDARSTSSRVEPVLERPPRQVFGVLVDTLPISPLSTPDHGDPPSLGQVYDGRGPPAVETGGKAAGESTPFSPLDFSKLAAAENKYSFRAWAVAINARPPGLRLTSMRRVTPAGYSAKPADAPLLPRGLHMLLVRTVRPKLL
jgi:hypothetical protein